MSNWLAVAAVTEALKFNLEQAIQRLLQVSVSSGRPGDVASPAGPAVNLYLYQVTPNAAWRNSHVPTRNGDGNFVATPRAALDLHYLVSFYGENAEQEAQQLLGLVVQSLEAQPHLTNEMIIAAKNAVKARHGTWLDPSTLENEVERVRFTPLPLSLEELSKLWSVFFQTPYALSVAYQASVVFIEPTVVLTPTQLVEDRGVYVVARRPLIDRVVPAAGAGAPIVAGALLQVQGSQLLALAPADTQLLLDGTDVMAQATSRSDRVIEVPVAATLPAAIPGVPLAPGIHSLQILQPVRMGSPPVPHSPGMDSNTVAFVVEPKVAGPITVTGKRGTGTAPRSANLNFSVDPPLAATDTASLTLIPTAGTEAPTIARITSGPNPLKVPVAGLVGGDYLVRLRVNGVPGSYSQDSSGLVAIP